MITLTKEQKEYFNSQLRIIEQGNPAMYYLIKSELEVVKNGGFDQKRSKAFLDSVKAIATVDIPNIEKIEDLAKKI